VEKERQLAERRRAARVLVRQFLTRVHPDTDDDITVCDAMIEAFDGHEATIWVGFDFPYSISDSVAFSADHVGPIHGVITDCTAAPITLRVQSLRRDAA